jgi:PAN domain
MSAWQPVPISRLIGVHWLQAALIALLLPNSPAAADIFRWQDLWGGIVITQQQCAAIPQAVWVSPKGRSFCMRYYLSTAGGQGSRPVVLFRGDYPFAGMADKHKVPPQVLPPDTHFYDYNTDALARAADRMSREQQTTAIYLARVGQDGSSGTHHSLRHTVLELLATNAALDEIKRQYGFEGFHIYGHSGGGNLAAGLLELRNDIGCDVPAEGQLAKPNAHGIKVEKGTSADPARQVFDVTEDVAVIARNRTARILVVTDPEDSIVRVEHQTPFVDKLRAAGRQVDQFFVHADDPGHHDTAGLAAMVVRDCVRGASRDEIAAHLAKLDAGLRAAKAGAVGILLHGINLFGADYSNLRLGSADPTQCQNACRSDAKCTAWTYIQPGVQGNEARCWLKDRVPQRSRDAWTISGIERAEEKTDKRN